MPTDGTQISPTDRDLMVRTVLGEADDQSPQGQAAVAHVIMNRVNDGSFGRTPGDVVLAKGQFEPWATRARQLLAIDRKSPSYDQASSIVDGVLSGDIPDPTGGATHFLNPDIVRARRKGSLPDWAQGASVRIGDHAFYAPGNPDYGKPTALDAIRNAIGGGPAMPAKALAFDSETPPAPAQQPPAGSLFRAAGFDVPQAANVAPQGAAPQSAAPSAPGSLFRDAGFDVPTKAADAPPAGEIVSPDGSRYTFDAQGHLLQSNDVKPPPVTTGATGTVASALRGAIDLPIVGPAMVGAAQRAGAAIRSTVHGVPYSDALADIRDFDARAQAEHPLAGFAGNVVGTGAAALPLGATALGGRLLGTAGSTIGARVYGGMLGGAGIGATDAVVRGQNPLAGAAVGGVAGAAGPLIGQAAQNATAGVVNALARPSGVLAGINPVARQWLSNALANETPASLQAATTRMGPHGFLSDINPPMTDLAAGLAARAEPPASAQISEAYRLRAGASRDRITDALDQAMGPRPNAQQFANFITENRAAAADPLYQQFRSMEVHPNQQIKDIMPTLDQLGLLNSAQEHALMRGVPFDRNFFTGGAQKNFPTTESWDMVKRAVDSRINTAYASGDNTKAADLISLKNRMLSAIESTPAGQVWRQARQEFADRSALLDQISAGRDTFLGGRSGTTVDQLREELRGLGQPELMARMVGMRDAIEQTMGETINGDTALRNRLLAPNNQEKLRLMLGGQNADQLVGRLEQERFLADQSRYVRPQLGSPTAGRSGAANALSAPPLPHWNPSVSQPLTWLPPSWIDALRPSTVLQGSREAAYAAARQQLAPVLLRQSAGSVLNELSAEAARRAGANALGGRVGQRTTLAITAGAHPARRSFNQSQTNALASQGQ